MKVYKAAGKEGYVELQFKNYGKDEELIRLLLEEKSVLTDCGLPEVEIITRGKKGDCSIFWVSTGLVVVSEKANL